MGIFSAAIGLHIFKSGGDKIRILNSGGDMSPLSPVIDAYGNTASECFLNEDTRMQEWVQVWV